MKKKFSWKNLIFIVALVLLIIPQTRQPIQVYANKVKMMIFSPSAFAKADQLQLQPFNYNLTSLDGDAVSAPIGQGEVTFISYWATWCPPCIAEMPSIQKLYDDYGDRIDFALITTEDTEVVKAFLQKKGYNLPVFIPAQETPKLLYESSIPTNYIIDKEGNIVVKEQGAQDWNSNSVRETLDTLLSKG